MRSKLSIELEKDELEELESIMKKCASLEDEVTIRLSSDKRKLARYVSRVIEEQKNFWEDEGY
ncbi:MAG: hypothetical protein IIC39_02630 [Candidatus Marinimicrobia bacterium]|nr:hypothetical protein [Candidatus Neomarinimicrobiota bacterium]MCH8304405.1 hypothetical protein [Candidatus Neomarinimicrobiota bacterium]TFB10561.1 hypothetical protein E3V36_03470 [Candidatus Marinimicrobia bacterium MT.SAG.2]